MSANVETMFSVRETPYTIANAVLLVLMPEPSLA